MISLLAVYFYTYHHSIKAPNSAVVELGEMGRLKQIQAVITNDFRVFVFGVEAVIERYALFDHFGDR